MNKKRGQIWVETVTYTLIALVLIGTVLAVVRPKLNELQDKAIIDQTLEVMESINKDVVSTANGATGSVRIPEFTMKKGYIEITTKDYEDSIIYTMEESSAEYSEPGVPVKIGNVIVETIDRGEYDIITLKLNYAYRYDLVSEGSSGDVISVPQSATTQRISFKKTGVEETPQDIPCNPLDTECKSGCDTSIPDDYCNDGNEYTQDTCTGGSCEHINKRAELSVKLA